MNNNTRIIIHKTLEREAIHTLMRIGLLKKED